MMANSWAREHFATRQSVLVAFGVLLATATGQCDCGRSHLAEAIESLSDEIMVHVTTELLRAQMAQPTPEVLHGNV